MKWITGFSRDRMGNLVAQVASEDGSVNPVQAEKNDLRMEVNEYGTPHHVQLNPAALHRTSCSDYFKGPLSMPSTLPQSAHAVFLGDVGGQKFLIPAQTLVRALFGAQKLLRQWLFHPGGLSIATDRSETWHHPNEFSLKATVDWLNSSMDLAASWASVYRNALEGRMDLTPPNSLCNFSAWGHKIGGIFHVTHLILFEVQERNSTRHIRPKNGLSTLDPRAALVAPSGILTEAQWRLVCNDLVAEFPPIGGKPAFTLRQRFQMLLFKRASNIRWNALNWSPAALASAQRFNSRMNKTDLWDRLMARLAEGLETVPDAFTSCPPATEQCRLSTMRDKGPISHINLRTYQKGNEGFAKENCP